MDLLPIYLLSLVIYVRSAVDGDDARRSEAGLARWLPGPTGDEQGKQTHEGAQLGPREASSIEPSLDLAF